MNSILEALYRGQFHPEEAIVPSHPEYRPLRRQIAAMTEQWKKRLSEEEFCELEELFDLCDRSDGMHIEAAFLHGLKLGSSIMIEVMTAREELVQNASSSKSL
ncbi:DUF6809 family protein [Paenibacillus sp. HW567]|uniref:DUF6809 family protein n=1 Tax=Paenibacillus sp. HW567 TaxID=1034769 RepID=UPI00036C81DD|nr:DUF6809 family protein [Paenibacillus sp. HW567]